MKTQLDELVKSRQEMKDSLENEDDRNKKKLELDEVLKDVDKYLAKK